MGSTLKLERSIYFIVFPPVSSPKKGRVKGNILTDAFGHLFPEHP